MKIEFVSQHPHRTRFLIISFNENENSTPVIPIVEAMKTIGWFEDPYSPPPVNGDEEITLCKNGSDIFNSWTPTEHDSFIKEAKSALKTLGFKTIPHRKLTMQDCL